MTRIEPKKLSKSYIVKTVPTSSADELYPLYSSNRGYFAYFGLDGSRDELYRDMTLLPDGCKEEQKIFLAYYEDEGGAPAAILDLIEGYPDSGVCYIGLFMVDERLSGRGIGTRVISELCEALAGYGFEAVRLAYGKRYERAARFWTKNGFVPLREAFLDEYGELIVAQRKL